MIDDQEADKIIEEAQKKAKKPGRKKKGYFDNEEFLNLINERNRLDAIQDKTREESIQLRRIRDKISSKYLEVATNFLKKVNFINYPESQQDDMRSDAVFLMNRAGERYNTNYLNPFAYLSQITSNAFKQSLNQMHKRVELFKVVDHLENFDGSDDSFD